MYVYIYICICVYVYSMCVCACACPYDIHASGGIICDPCPSHRQVDPQPRHLYATPRSLPFLLKEIVCFSRSNIEPGTPIPHAVDTQHISIAVIPPVVAAKRSAKHGFLN